MAQSKAAAWALLALLGLALLARASATESEFCREKRRECEERCGKHAEVVSQRRCWAAAGAERSSEARNFYRTSLGYT
jgi:hypothetical protein